MQTIYVIDHGHRGLPIYLGVAAGSGATQAAHVILTAPPAH